MSESSLHHLAAPFRAFAAGLDRGRSVVVLCHSDCDGLASGAILVRALRRAGYAVEYEVTGKGGSAWAPEIAPRLLRHNPGALLVADLGCRAEPVLPGVPTTFIDHHRPTGVPPDSLLVTGYGTDPTPTSGLLAWECAKHLADVVDLDWLVALSLIGDLAEADWPDVMAAVRTRHKITHLRDAAALVNAARRSASGDAGPAARLLIEAAGPKDVTAGPSPDVAALKAAKVEVSAALAAARKIAPKVVGTVALVRVHSPCQIHPLVVQSWRTRLAKNIVIVANTGYVPGRVNFSVRSALAVNLLDFLKEHAPPDPGPNYGNGHDRATGGALTFDQWDRFAAGLGFGPEAMVGDNAVARVT